MQQAPRIAAVAVRADRIELHLLLGDGGDARLRVAEAEPFEAAPGRTLPAGPLAVRDGAARISLPRYDSKRDRLYSRWQLIDRAGRPVGEPQWATELLGVAAQSNPIAIPKSPKGITCPVDDDDVIRLGTKWINTNVTLTQALDLKNPNPRAWWEVDGERFPINVAYFEGLDRSIKRYTDAGIHTVVVLNNPLPTSPDPDNPFVHPKSDLAGAPNHLGAFNLTDRRGYRAYRAVLEFFAARYSRPDAKYGTIGGYIVGNEIQQHWEWYNRGPVQPDAFLSEYAVALRVTWLALQKANPNLRAYVSMDHHWTASMKGDPTREVRGDVVLKTLGALSRAGGDFPWHVAFHPYPENLFNPRFWNDRAATLSYDTPKITFKNLEVLPAFLNLPEQRCRGAARRVILSEQGFHAGDGAEAERLQAAAYAAAYYRVSRMPGIDAFLLHRHVSHRGEGGLRLGLWTWDPNSPDPSKPGRKLPSWDIYRQADTPAWRAAFAFALPIVGIRDWSELDPAPKIAATRPPKTLAPGVLIDLTDRLGEATRVNCADLRLEQLTLDGREAVGIFQHPNPKGDADATFTLRLPRPERAVFRFRTGFTGATRNGARFTVLIDGRPVWSEVQTGQAFVAREAPIPPVAEFTLTLRVNGLDDIAFDWCCWAVPQIVRA